MDQYISDESKVETLLEDLRTYLLEGINSLPIEERKIVFLAADGSELKQPKSNVVLQMDTASG